MPKIEKRNGKYRIRVYIGKDASGKKIYKSFTGTDKKTLRHQAAEYADEARYEIQHPRANAFKDELENYITDSNSRLSPSTIRGYRSIQRSLEANNGWFLETRIDEITRAVMTRLVNELSRGRSPKTVRNIHGLIVSVLKYAGYNAPPVRLPETIKSETAVPDNETVRKILLSVKGTDLEVPIGLAICGLRRGEICGAGIVDLKGNVLHVRHSRVQDEYGMFVTRDAPKTTASDRYVEIPAALAKKIRKQGYVTNLSPEQLSRFFDRHLKKNGFPHYKLHAMRHWFATYCHNTLGLPDAQIQRLGGWETDQVMKRVYRHSSGDDEVDRRVSSAIGKMFG